MLEQLLTEINKQKKDAEIDIDAVDPRVREHVKGKIRRAKNQLEQLYVEYKNEILKRSVFIMATGQNARSFANIAEEEYKCFKIDGDTFFKDIVDEVHPDLYEGKTVNSSVFEVLNNLLEDRMKNLDVISYNSLMFDTRYQKTVKDKNELIQVARDAITDIIGGEVLGLDALERVSREAVNREYKSKMVPIVIYSEDEKFIKKASEQVKNLTTKVFVVNSKENDAESVGNTLKEIASKA
jgi:hypothetical protein